jgi:uncharacterized protein (TIGR02246 family)
MVDEWMQRYVQAWSTDDPEDIGALFTEDARYFTEPYAEPWNGREEIVRKWVEGGDSNVEWAFAYGIVAVDGDVAVIRGLTEYAPEKEGEAAKIYHNLWVIRFADDGRALEFTEWWMKTKAPAS